MFISGFTQPEEVRRGIQLGADDYVKKPYDLDDLVRRVHRAIERHRATALDWKLPSEVSPLPSRVQRSRIGRETVNVWTTRDERAKLLVIKIRRRTTLHLMFTEWIAKFVSNPIAVSSEAQKLPRTGNVSYTLYLERDLKDELRLAAARLHTTVSAIMRKMVCDLIGSHAGDPFGH